MFLDFNGRQINSFILNGHKLDIEVVKESWKENKIYLDKKLLRDEGNVLECHVCNQFNNDQFGFVIGRDPDGGRYVYIQTVPYYASRIIPMFDQPDIKGKYSISVLHSASDECVTTGPLVCKSLLSEAQFKEENTWIKNTIGLLGEKTEGIVLSIFEETPYLSSYLLNLVCGPLVSIEAQEYQLYKGIQMKIMCRSKHRSSRITRKFCRKSKK